MICKKTIKIAMGVGMVLCASASFAAVNQGFDAATTGVISISGWSGDGTIEAGNPAYDKPVGAPVATTANPSVNTLLVEGTVTCANTPEGSPTASISDFLVFIPEPSDELGTDGLDDAKVAIAAGTTCSEAGEVPLCLYCKNRSDVVNWYEISNVPTGTWLRVTLAFQNGRCRVSVDGEPVKNAIGYKESTGTSADAGAWYNLVGSGNAVQSLAFVGCAKVDDVVIKDEFLPEVFGDKKAVIAGSSDGVKYDDLNTLGITSAEVAENLHTTNYLGIATGMSVKERLECGYSLATATKFEPVSITKTAANQATIKFPIESTDELARYSVRVEGGTAIVGEAAAVQGEDGFATIGLTNITYNENSNVIKFILKATSPSSGSGSGE